MNIIFILGIKIPESIWGPIAYKLGKIPEFRKFMHYEEISEFISNYWIIGLYSIIAFCLICVIVNLLIEYCQTFQKKNTNSKEVAVMPDDSNRKDILIGISVCTAILMVCSMCMYAFDLFPGKPEAVIKKSWIETSITKNGKNGFVVHFDCEAHYLKDKELTFTTSFMDTDSIPVNNRNIFIDKSNILYRFGTARQLNLRDTSFTVTQKHSSFSNLHYFIPDTAVIIKDGVSRYLYKVEVYYYKNHKSYLVGSSDYNSFQLEKITSK